MGVKSVVSTVLPTLQRRKFYRASVLEGRSAQGHLRVTVHVIYLMALLLLHLGPSVSSDGFSMIAHFKSRGKKALATQ